MSNIDYNPLAPAHESLRREVEKAQSAIVQLNAKLLQAKPGSGSEAAIAETLVEVKALALLLRQKWQDEVLLNKNSTLRPLVEKQKQETAHILSKQAATFRQRADALAADGTQVVLTAVQRATINARIIELVYESQKATLEASLALKGYELIVHTTDLAVDAALAAAEKARAAQEQLEVEKGYAAQKQLEAEQNAEKYAAQKQYVAAEAAALAATQYATQKQEAAHKQFEVEQVMALAKMQLEEAETAKYASEKANAIGENSKMYAQKTANSEVDTYAPPVDTYLPPVNTAPATEILDTYTPPVEDFSPAYMQPAPGTVKNLPNVPSGAEVLPEFLPVPQLPAPQLPAVYVDSTEPNDPSSTASVIWRAVPWVAAVGFGLYLWRRERTR